jgi:gamma-glutamyltranspeptidase/glutathione hydrolase
MADGTGVLLNNEIDDFAIADAGGDLWGPVRGTANVVRGGVRPMSSMAPTIVEDPDGRPLLALGTPGGPTIITTVFQVIVHVIDEHLGLQAAVEAPRFHHQGFPDRIEAERDGAVDDVVRALEERGHDVRIAPRPIGAVAAVGRTPDGRWIGAADPRRRAVAGGL